jgi:hypothetical protein
MTAAFPATMPGRLPQQDTFEACSAFTHVTACLFAEPLKRPFSSRAPTGSLPPRSSRLLPAGATVAGWELHPLKIAAFARRTLSSVTAIDTPILQSISQGSLLTMRCIYQRRPIRRYNRVAGQGDTVARTTRVLALLFSIARLFGMCASAASFSHVTNA